MALRLGDDVFSSRLLLGTAQFPSPEKLAEAIRRAKVEIVTVSLRRQSPEKQAGRSFWDLIRSLGVRVLPNTAGCRSAKEAIALAHLARELFQTPWIKLEVTSDEETLRPDPFALIEATQSLVKDGFEVFPYTTEDPILAEKLTQAGCRILMPWGSPIGTGRGLIREDALRALRVRFPDCTLFIDAGIGAPSHAARAMELGYDGVLLNTAVALAADPPRMAEAFRLAVDAGHAAYHAGLMPQRNFAVPSTPVVGTPFWHEVKL